MSTNDGGPAFPCPHLADQFPATGGMSLRDWFAGQALTGMLAFPIGAGDGPHYAKCAYKMADDMLAAREKDRP